MGANRIVANNVITSATIRISKLNQINASCEAELRFTQVAMDELVKSNKAQSGQIGDLQGSLIEVGDKNRKLRTWATIGKVGVVTFAVLVVAVTVVSVVP